MKSLAGFLLSFAIFMPIVATPSASPLIPDGKWWASLSSGERRDAVEMAISAFTSGYIYGFTDGQDDTLTASHAPFNTLAEKVRNDGYASGQIKYSQPYSFYTAAVTGFYNGASDRSNIPLYLVVACLADAPRFSCDSLKDYNHSLDTGRRPQHR